jgi:ribosomal protein S26
MFLTGPSSTPSVVNAQRKRRGKERKERGGGVKNITCAGGGHVIENLAAVQEFQATQVGMRHQLRDEIVRQRGGVIPFDAQSA